MPQYIFDVEGTAGDPPVYFGDLSEFAQGYIECLFFTSEAPGVTTEKWQATEEHAEGSIPGDVGFNDIAPDALAAMLIDCQKFQAEAHGLLNIAYAREGYSEKQAGRDFAYTRNGAGVGFWDRDALENGGLGDTLSNIACKMLNCDLYLGDDGRVYYS